VFLKCSTREKGGKEHRSWSVVESRRYGDGKVEQRHVLDNLGEINDSQRLAWEPEPRLPIVAGRDPERFQRMSDFPCAILCEASSAGRRLRCA